MNWEIAYTNSFEEGTAGGFDYRTPDELRRSGMSIIAGRVPGYFENELVNLGIENDYLHSENVKNLEKYKDTHVWYFTSFNAFDFSCLHFDKLDANAVIYVNGEQVLATEEYLGEIEISDGIKEGHNTAVIHIFPRKSSRNTAAKAIGVDPKGIPGEVILRRKRKCEIKDAYVRTVDYNKDSDTAKIRLSATVEVRPDCRHELSHLKFRAVVKDDKRVYQQEGDIFSDRIDCTVEVSRPKLWWPRNYGRSNLYDASICVLDGGKQLDVFDTKTGIRTVSAFKSGPSVSDFEVFINGIKVFLSGANATATELLKEEDEERIEGVVSAASEMNCNVLRYFGGYAPEAFLDACDKYGIAVIQVFPGVLEGISESGDLTKRLSEEAVGQVKRLRNHPSLCMFSSDPSTVPFSAAIFEDAVSKYGGQVSIVKPDFHDSVSLSEEIDPGKAMELLGGFLTASAGSAALPAASSLRRFIHKKACWPLFDESGDLFDVFTCHLAKGCRPSFAAGSTVSDTRKYFGDVPGDLYGFTCRSQLIQAELIKQYIELYRSLNEKSGGVIAFDLNDPHTLISGAVLDYYLEKKAACAFIKRSLAPLCLMIIRQGAGSYTLKAVNDLPYGDQVTYLVKDVTEGSALLDSGVADIFAFGNSSLSSLTLTPDHFYQITWTTRAGRTYTNHFFAAGDSCTLKDYLAAMAAAGYEEPDKNRD